MNYKETLFFVAKCLTISKEEKNKIYIKNLLQKEVVDWDNVVKVSTAHFVFPALYINLKKVDFLHYLPNDLVEYMQHITDLNRERNQQIIEQAKEINSLLLSNNITPIFLKGTGNLLENLYDDIAERMVGDIDFIVSSQHYMRSINILKDNSYYSEKDGHNERTFHWHYAKLIKKGSIASVEVHSRILSKANNKYFNVFKGEKKYYNKGDYYFFNNKYKLLNTTLPKIINDNLYLLKTIPLRTMYDVYLISQLEKIELPNISSKSKRQKLLNYIACMELAFNASFIEETSKNKSKRYIKTYLNLLNNSKVEKIKISCFYFLYLQKSRLSVLFNAFFDKEYRNYSLKRILKKDLYKRILNLK